MCVRIFGELYVASSSPQPLEVWTALSYRHVIVGRAMELPNGCRAQIGIADERSAARGIERNVGHKRGSGIPHLLEPLHARIESGLPAARKSHHRDACRVDPRMSGEHIECAISVEDHIEPAEQCLVGRGTGQPASREAVDDERRNPHLVESLCPKLVAAVYAARAMLENNCR